MIRVWKFFRKSLLFGTFFVIFITIKIHAKYVPSSKIDFLRISLVNWSNCVQNLLKLHKKYDFYCKYFSKFWIFRKKWVNFQIMFYSVFSRKTLEKLPTFDHKKWTQKDKMLRFLYMRILQKIWTYLSWFLLQHNILALSLVKRWKNSQNWNFKLNKIV